jgi:hypothetical protein
LPRTCKVDAPAVGVARWHHHEHAVGGAQAHSLFCFFFKTMSFIFVADSLFLLNLEYSFVLVVV